MHFDASQFELNRQDGAKRLKPNAVPLLFQHVPVAFARKPPMKRSPHASPRKQIVTARINIDHSYVSSTSAMTVTSTCAANSSPTNDEG